MRKLVLRQTDDFSLDTMYYAAISIADVAKAEKLYKVYQAGGVPKDFWRQAFLAMHFGENALISAIVNQLQMPFGAYVIERCDEDCIEVAPWMFSSKFDREAFVKGLFSENVTEEYIRSQQRMFELTAAFLYWLDRYGNPKEQK